MAAEDELRATYPGLKISVTEIKVLSEMEKYTAVMILPSLVVNGELVCVGRFPKKDEVMAWFKAVLEKEEVQI